MNHSPRAIVHDALNRAWRAWCAFAYLGVAQRTMLELIVPARFKDSLMSVLTSVVAAVFYIYYYDFVRQNVWYSIVLFSWVVVTLIYHAIAVYLKRQEQVKVVLSDVQLQNYMGITVLISIWQSVVVSLMAIEALRHGANGLNSPAVIGAVFFFVGLSMVVFVCATSVWLTNVILILPLMVYFLVHAQAGERLIAGFLLLLMSAVWSFSRTQREAFIEQVEQKAQLERLTHALKIEKNRAEAANQAKSHFFTSASHDARQPLQAISLLSESLIRSTQLQTQDRQLVEKIGANLHAIRNLFNRVLDISRIEGGSLQPQMQTVRLADIFAQLEQQYSEIAAHRQLWLRFVPTDVLVWHDPELLQRMLGNIIHNAVHFTERGGVWVAYRAQRGCIEIRDSGIGIALDQQDKVFEEFYQLNNAERRRDRGAGSGLGLSIVSRMAQLTETQISLRSTPQRGSVFSVYCHPCSELAVARNPSDMPPTAENQMVEALHGTQLLYVEDDDELRALFIQALSAYGIQVNACANTDEVDDYVQQHPNAAIDVLLTDYRLPDGQTGIAVAQKVRSGLMRHVPTIIITGDTQIHSDDALNHLHDVRILQKPVQVKELVEIVHGYMKRD